MQKHVEFTLRDGSKIIIETDELESDAVKAGHSMVPKIARGEFGQAVEPAHKAATIILEKVRDMLDAPDEIEVAFGLKASSDLEMLVVASKCTEASYSVKLKWSRLQSKGNTKS